MQFSFKNLFKREGPMIFCSVCTKTKSAFKLLVPRIHTPKINKKRGDEVSYCIRHQLEIMFNSLMINQKTSTFGKRLNAV